MRAVKMFRADPAQMDAPQLVGRIPSIASDGFDRIAIEFVGGLYRVIGTDETTGDRTNYGDEGDHFNALTAAGWIIENYAGRYARSTN
jgi:hypothetical protein